MSEWRHLRAQDARIVPWRNGRGVTRELWVSPSTATIERLDFSWRVSLAGVTEDGPFSRFPGLERWLVLTRGAGLRLFHGANSSARELCCGQPYRFSGALRTRAELIEGPVEDFNLIFRPEHWDVQVDWLASGEHSILPNSAQCFAHCAAGEAQLAQQRLSAGESLFAERAGPTRVKVENGAMICVRMTALSATMSG